MIITMILFNRLLGYSLIAIALISSSGCVTDSIYFKDHFDIPDDLILSPYISNSPNGNSTILCAKEHTFEDGTPPTNEWFLLGEPVTNNLYYSKALESRYLIGRFIDDIQEYSFGIMSSGDIIACKRAEYLDKGGRDANRANPIVLKYSEKWAIQHVVDFGETLKPCGWARNEGFRSLPDGSAMICEYTRVTVATANVWKISGDPLIPANWKVKKSFRLSGEVDKGFKHCHAILYDHFTGTMYLTTGDDNSAAMVFASTDLGENWIQLREPSEQECRLSSMTFTKDYIYWGQDSPGLHYFYRGERVSGVLDYSTVIPFVTIPGDKDHYFATYGQAYLPEYNCVLLLDRQDSSSPGQVLPIRIVDLSTGKLETIGYVACTDPDGGLVGFRTVYSEWYPVNGRIHLGFGFGPPTFNKNKVCGNKWPIYKGANSVNNLCLCVKKNEDEWSLSFETIYL